MQRSTLEWLAVSTLVLALLAIIVVPEGGLQSAGMESLDDAWRAWALAVLPLGERLGASSLVDATGGQVALNARPLWLVAAGLVNAGVARPVGLALALWSLLGAGGVVLAARGMGASRLASVLGGLLVLASPLVRSGIAVGGGALVLLLPAALAVAGAVARPGLAVPVVAMAVWLADEVVPGSIWLVGPLVWGLGAGARGRRGALAVGVGLLIGVLISLWWGSMGPSLPPAITPWRGAALFDVGAVVVLIGLVLAVRGSPRVRLLAVVGVVGVVLGLGATLVVGGEQLSLGGRAVPLPGALLQAIPWAPAGLPWRAGLAVGLVAITLAAVVGMPRRRLLLAVLALGVEGVVRQPSLAPGEAPAEARVARWLASSGEGAVLDLPIGGDGPRLSRYRVFQAVHGRPLLTAGRGLSPLHQEPLVVLAINAERGGAPYRIPAVRPGEVLSSLGVRSVVLHRDLLSVEALAIIDPLLRGCFAPPVRDLALNIDVFRVPEPSGEGTPRPLPLEPVDEPSPTGGIPMTDWLRAWAARRLPSGDWTDNAGR